MQDHEQDREGEESVHPIGKKIPYISFFLSTFTSSQSILLLLCCPYDNQLLDLLETLVRHEKYSDPLEQSKLIPVLITVLDGKNDEPTGPQRYEYNELNDIVMVSQIDCVLVLDRWEINRSIYVYIHYPPDHR